MSVPLEAVRRFIHFSFFNPIQRRLGWGSACRKASSYINTDNHASSGIRTYARRQIRPGGLCDRHNAHDRLEIPRSVL
jgi:hypothetical protein